MKRISTLLAFACLTAFTSKAFGQSFPLGFNSTTEMTDLRNNCWIFNSIDYSSQSPLNGTGSLMSVKGNLAEIISPLLSLSGKLSITLTYNLLNQDSGTKKIQVYTWKANTGNWQKLDPNGYTMLTGKTTVTLSFNGVTGDQKIKLDLSPTANVQIDDLTINGTYVNPGACAVAPIILPVKLMSFTGSAINNKAQLKWSVADNETGDHFLVLRSTDGKSYSEVGTVFANEKAGTESYSLDDAVELAPVTYYRLKTVNKDKSFAYSNVIILKSATGVEGSALTILQNPVGSTLNFSYTSATPTQSNVVIYNAAGAKVYSLKVNMQRGTNAVSFSLDSKMAPGTYILEVSNATERSVAKLIKK